MLRWLQRLVGGDGTSRAALERRVRSPEAEVRQDAADALAGVNEPWAPPLLLVLFKDMVPEVRTAARDALRRHGIAATGVLIQAVEYADPKVAVPAAELLGEVKDLDAIRPLLLVMKFGSPEIRAAATRALISYGRAAIPGLMLACEDPDPWTRSRGEEILAAIRAAENAAPGVSPSEAARPG